MPTFISFVCIQHNNKNLLIRNNAENNNYKNKGEMKILINAYTLSASILRVEERGLECESADIEAAQTALDHTLTLARRVPCMICVRR